MDAAEAERSGLSAASSADKLMDEALAPRKNRIDVAAGGRDAKEPSTARSRHPLSEE